MAILTVGLLRTPIPQVDYHTIEHHHHGGELCPNHNHLLRWHPGAACEDDAAVFHLHWFMPYLVKSDGSPASEETSPSASLTAFTGDFTRPDSTGDLLLHLNSWSRSPQCLELQPSVPSPELLPLPAADPCSPHRVSLSRGTCARLHPPIGLLGLCQQRNC